MPTLVQPPSTTEPVQHSFDEVSFQDIFLAASEELDYINTNEDHVNAIKFSYTASPVGPLLLGVHDQRLRFLIFADTTHLIQQIIRLQHRLEKPLRAGSHRLLDKIEDELGEYFARHRECFTVPLDAEGTHFQRKVWQGLQQIPYGKTWTYEELATHIGQPSASRAVGLANGANQLAIIIPCHRVINKDGNLGGYGGGQWRKQILLDLERDNSTR